MALNHKREQDNHPQPVGSAETGAVEQWERGEEGSAEGDERGEGELPLSARGVDNEATLFFRFSQTEYQGVGSLYKHEKHQQGRLKK